MQKNKTKKKAYMRGHATRYCGGCLNQKEIYFAVPEGKKQVQRLCLECWNNKGYDIVK